MYFKRRLYKPSNSIFIWPFPYMNYLDQSTNQSDGLAGRCQGLFPPQLHSQGKRPGDEVDIVTVLYLRITRGTQLQQGQK